MNARRTHITAIYARRDEPDSLVADLHTNLAWVDDFLEFQVPREGGWTHEGEKLAAMRAEAARRRAGWLLWTAPDERFQDGAEAVIRRAIATANPATLFRFPFRELWTPTQYRIDGLWKKRPRNLLWYLPWPTFEFSSKPMHAAEWPVKGFRRRWTLDVCVYHLKCIDPANRVARAEAYLAADPEFRHQRQLSRDWSYLYDEAGMVLRDIEPGRGYSPAYVPGSYTFVVPR